ncbi:MAG TPA: TolC family protein, partial [Opitutales bacterium]|nr:TolC family protein [Opitutales bacterium]
LALLAGGCQHYVDRPLAPDQTAAQLLSRTLTSPDLQKFLQQNTGRDFAEWPPKAWDFDTLNWVAFYYNPSLEVARAQWAGAQGGIVTGAQRPNPTINFSPGYDFNPAAGTISPWFLGGSFDLPIETAGKREKRIGQAQWTAEAARQSIFAAAWQVRADLRAALIELGSAQDRAQLIHAQVAAQQRIVDLLEQRFNAGAATADEVSLARLALIKAQTDASATDRALVLARTHLSAALGVTAGALEGQNFAVASMASTRSFTPAELAAARAVSLQTRADILAALANYQASQAALQLEIAKQYPDLHLGSGYLYDLGENKWNLSLGIELPIFNHNQGPIAEAEAARRVAAAQLLAAQARVIAQIDAAAAVNAAAAGTVDGLQKIDAELHQHLDRVRAQADAGAVDQLEYQTAQLDLGASRLALLDAQTQAAAAAGQLEDALQVPFANLPAVQNDPAPSANPAQP